MPQTTLKVSFLEIFAIDNVIAKLHNTLMNHSVVY